MDKTINSTVTQFLYDGMNPVQELDGSNAVTANLLTGLGIDEYFARSDSSGTMAFLTDALGSTAGLVGSGGSIDTGYTYQPFGATTVVGANANSYQFTGRENDGTGLYFYRNRFYSPTLQRFVSQDPSGFGGGDTNLYAYANENPISLKDPEGRCVEDLCIGETIAAVEIGEFLWSAASVAAGVATGAVVSHMESDGGGDKSTNLPAPPAPGNQKCSSGQKSPDPNKRFTPDQSALIDLAKEAKQAGNLSPEDAQSLQDWADELNIESHGPESHPNRNFDIEHIHIGPIDHIPIK
jgi:RHS repeat-associated protein